MFNFLKKKKPESNNNNAEQAASDSNVEPEYPAFDPEAAQRARDEYLEKNNTSHHSDRVEDIDKAHAMAIEGDGYETLAVKAKKLLDKYNEAASHADNSADRAIYQTKADLAKEQLRRIQTDAKYAEESAGDHYDRNKEMQKIIDRFNASLEASESMAKEKKKEN